jgi:hypothetical protein
MMDSVETPPDSFHAVSHQDEGTFLDEMSARYDLPVERAAEIIEDVEEHLAGRFQAETASTDFMRMFRDGVGIVISARTWRQQGHLLRCLLLALRWHHLLDGVSTPTELARRLGMTKANTDKFYCMFRDSLPDGLKVLPAAPGQRDEQTRAGFADIRRQQEKQRTT